MLFIIIIVIISITIVNADHLQIPIVLLMVYITVFCKNVMLFPVMNRIIMGIQWWCVVMCVGALN